MLAVSGTNQVSLKGVDDGMSPFLAFKVTFRVNSKK